MSTDEAPPIAWYVGRLLAEDPAAVPLPADDGRAAPFRRLKMAQLVPQLRERALKMALELHRDHGEVGAFALGLLPGGCDCGQPDCGIGGADYDVVLLPWMGGDTDFYFAAVKKTLQANKAVAVVFVGSTIRTPRPDAPSTHLHAGECLRVIVERPVTELNDTGGTDALIWNGPQSEASPWGMHCCEIQWAPVIAGRVHDWVTEPVPAERNGFLYDAQTDDGHLVN